eukprot:CAMPEP_0194346656 /NCGR_PEP_ID=MMETSP0171-20130528/105551_1 /TAXON_ID=218684 /ORGANISM="Corethron pennatum, Strain L29A3" /LENGTH=123 /DNA_ID=CAMNT_0039113815 /DNA_START=626 /DNA_END=994 /DNA_ORIENTATION=+
MNDCPKGTFCRVAVMGVNPECQDCSKVLKDFKFTATDFNNICPATEFFKDYDISNEHDKWKLRDHIDIDYDELLMTKTTPLDDTVKCLSYLHCDQMEIDKDSKFVGECDFLKLNIGKMDVGTW